MSSKPALMRLLVVLSLACLWQAAQASELVYTPNNPSFGGNPSNGIVLLNSAQAQNKFTDPGASLSATSGKTDLQNFNDLLQRSMLSRLATSATTNLIGASGQLVPGSLDTGSFRIDIVDLHNGNLRITTTDKTTQESTTFEVGK